MQPILLSGGGVFEPVTRTYTEGTGQTETVPSGASQVRITARGGGASGGRNNIVGASGGGGGAYVQLTIAVTALQTMTYTVGVGGASRTTNGGQLSGTATTVTGTVQGGTININANASNGLIGGVASGGDTNINGEDGVTGEFGIYNGAGGAGGGPGGGAGGVANGGNGQVPGGGGGGGNNPDPSGAGARGALEFYYT